MYYRCHHEFIYLQDIKAGIFSDDIKRRDCQSFLDESGFKERANTPIQNHRSTISNLEGLFELSCTTKSQEVRDNNVEITVD